MIKYGKKITEIEKRLPMLIDSFSKREDILVMYLFGSRAINKADDLSDIDIAILLKSNELSFEKELYLSGEITSLLGTEEVSVVLLNKAPLVISYGVLKESKVLFCANDNLRLDFEEKIIKQYLDFRYHLNIYDNEFISMIKSPEVT